MSQIVGSEDLAAARQRRDQAKKNRENLGGLGIVQECLHGSPIGGLVPKTSSVKEGARQESVSCSLPAVDFITLHPREHVEIALIELEQIVAQIEKDNGPRYRPAVGIRVIIGSIRDELEKK